MKKKLAMLLLTGVLALSSCGNNTDQDSSSKQSFEPSESSNSEESFADFQESSSSDDLDAIGQIDVEEGIFDVELTIPADFIGEQTQSDLDETAKEYGFKSIILNSDGSATYTMTKQQHEKLMEEYRTQLNNTLNELVGSEDYPNFTAIEANENFTEFTITTKSTELDMTESFSVIAFYMLGGWYNAFNGEEVSNISVTFVNATTGEVISTSNSNDTQ